MSNIQIRLAEDTDNDLLAVLSRKCPQEGMITFFKERTPRFNTLHRHLDPGSWHYVACADERIIGLVGVVHFRARMTDRICKVAYMLDLRLEKEYRGGTTAFKMIKTAIDHLQVSDADAVLVNFLKDNRRPLVFASGRGGLPPAQYLGDNIVFNMLPVRTLRLDKRFVIDRLRESDIPEVVGIYKKYAASFKIAPVIDEALLEKYLTTVKGLSAENFLVARENGKIKAVTALWDEHAYITYHVLKMKFSIRVATGILNFLSKFMRVPHPVRVNEPLRQLSLVLYAHDDCPEALDTLFRHANNTCRGSEYTMIMLYAHASDPIFRFVTKYTGIAVRSEMYLFSKDTSVFERLAADPSPVMFDPTMVM